MCETVGRVWRVRMSEVNAEGVIVGSSARRRSGLSRMIKVFRCGFIEAVDAVVEVERSEETAPEIVLRRCARSRLRSV